MSSPKLAKAKIEQPETPKKKFSWSVFWYYARTLFKNDSCIEVGVKTKWYWTIILFVFALGFAMLPLAVNNAKTKGSSAITTSGYTDSFTLGLTAYLNDEDASDILFQVEDDGIKATATGSVDGEKIYVYEKAVDDGSSTISDLLFTIYYYEYTGTAFDNFLEDVQTYDVNGDTRDSSFVVFGKEDFYLQSQSTGYTSVYSIGGNYKYFYSFIDDSTSSFTLRNYLSLANGDYAALTSDAILANFCNLVDSAYITNRNIVVGVYIGISCGVNGGIIILMGLVYFIMTRGKNSLFKELKFYHFIGISMWASLSPALITLVLGFIITGGYEIMIFIFAFGVRAMFLSMRQLKPPV